jgi:hypothetical protein
MQSQPIVIASLVFLAAACQENLIPIPSGAQIDDIAAVDGTKVATSALTVGGQTSTVIAGLAGASPGKGLVHVEVDGATLQEAHTHDDGTFAALVAAGPGTVITLRFQPDGQDDVGESIQLADAFESLSDMAVGGTTGSQGEGGAGGDSGEDGGAGTGGTAAPGDEPTMWTPGTQGVVAAWGWIEEGTLRLNGAPGFAPPGARVIALNGTLSTSSLAVADAGGSVSLTIPAAPGDALWYFAEDDTQSSSADSTEAPPAE